MVITAELDTNVPNFTEFDEKIFLLQPKGFETLTYVQKVSIFTTKSPTYMNLIGSLKQAKLKLLHKGETKIKQLF